MATQRAAQLIAPTVLTTGSVAGYTCPAGCKTIIKHLAVANPTATARTFTLTISAGAIQTTVTVAPLTTLIVYCALNHVMSAGDTIATLASANSALTLFASGIEIF